MNKSKSEASSLYGPAQITDAELISSFESNPLIRRIPNDATYFYFYPLASGESTRRSAASAGAYSKEGLINGFTSRLPVDPSEVLKVFRKLGIPMENKLGVMGKSRDVVFYSKRMPNSTDFAFIINRYEER